MNTIRKINFVEFHAKLNTLEPSHIVPKYGTPLLAAIMKEKGYNTRILLEGISDMSVENMIDCDLLCVPMYSALIDKIRNCALRIRKVQPELPIILGGPMAGILPLNLIDEFIFNLGDYLVRCEGDEVLPELVEGLNSGRNLKEINGISFKMGNRIIHTPDRQPPEYFPTIPDPTLIDGFEKAMKGTKRFRFLNLLQTSRGCAFKCSFCPTNKLFSGSYRNRDIESVIADIKIRQKYSKLFLVVDNSFLSNKKRSAKLLEQLIEENMDAGFIVFERYDIGYDKALLALMKEAKVLSIIVGIESLDDENLDLYNKKQESVKVQQAVRNIIGSDIHVIGTFMLGGDADTKEKADNIVKFVKKTGISLNLFIMHDTEFDETRDHVVPFNRRFYTYYRNQDPDNTNFWDYMTGNFVTYFPKRMKPSTLQQTAVTIYKEVYSHKNILKNIFSKNLFQAVFGISQGYMFKRLNENVSKIVDTYYLDYLKNIEDGLYDENEVLMEEKIQTLNYIPIPEPLITDTDDKSYNTLISLCVIPGLIRLGIKKLLWNKLTVWKREVPSETYN